MDPDATLELIFEAIHAGDKEELAERVEDLETWIRRGGYPPERMEDLVDVLRRMDVHHSLVELFVGAESLSTDVLYRKRAAVVGVLRDHGIPENIAMERASNLAAALSFPDEDPRLASKQILTKEMYLKGHTVTDEVIERVAETWKNS